jgi:SAM-dependent methyltransferase
LTTGLAFVLETGAPEYGAWFSRLRWRRAVEPALVREIRSADRADAAFRGADSWVVVRDPGAVPVGSWTPRATEALGVASGISTLVSPQAKEGAIHTIRELEAATDGALHRTPAMTAPALVFRAADFPPRGSETSGELLARVESAASPLPDLFALVVEDPSDSERPELSRRIPTGARRLLDAGCGSGATSAALKRREGQMNVTGLEIDPRAAARAAGRLDRVMVGDAAPLLAALAAAGERFDAFLMGDVLEHTADPVALLAAARAASETDGTLVASVPNVSHLSIVRDLLLGRFDPAPAGLEDAGHLRWFTAGFLAQCLEEAGWRVEEMAGEPGAAAAESEKFRAFLAGWPAADEAASRDSLGVYQWIAVARAA